MRMTRSILLLFVALVMLAISARSFGQINVSITVGPPELPVYEQPVCPGDGYIWTPGYWAYADDDYYWVPGTWVEAPEVGLLWTPGYWSWNGAGFVFNEGYWGPQVGFYGGISYGFGYFGRGYEGGRWDNGHFFYNRSVTNVDVTIIHNVYNTTVVNNTTVRVSYNGGNGGINARPTPAEEAMTHERHVSPVAAQVQHVQAARANPELRAAANHGKPPIAATPKPGAFRDRAAIPAKEAGAHDNGTATRAADPSHSKEPATHPENDVARGAAAVHPNDLPPTEHPAPTSTGNPKQDKKYQQEQDKLNAKQDQERQKLQQSQEQDHQRLAQQKADDGKKQQLEQQHQQQTQQLQQKHAEQQQQLQEKQQRANRSQSKPPKEKT